MHTKLGEPLSLAFEYSDANGQGAGFGKDMCGEL